MIAGSISGRYARVTLALLLGAVVWSGCTSAENHDAGRSEGGEAGTPAEMGEAGQGAAAGEGGACGTPCGDVCCVNGDVCEGESRCIPEQEPCESDDECEHDTRCDDGVCVPYGVDGQPAFNEDCKLETSLSKIEPVVQCHWQDPPDGDPHPTFNQVMSTPVVADLGLDDDPDAFHPSIVFTVFAGETNYEGYVRVISGADCSEQLALAEDAELVNALAPATLGDLTGDGLPEIVVAAKGGGLMALRVSDDKKALEKLWRSGTCAGDTRTQDVTGGSGYQAAGASLVDLTNDGVPEVVLGATVYDSEGCILSSSLGYTAYNYGVIPVLSDIDDDGKVELVTGNALYEWDADDSDWTAETSFTPTSSVATGQVAVAELGDFPLENHDGRDFPEIAVVSNGTLRVQTLDGTVVFGPFPIPGGGIGGAPTIADFDGDGRPEIATAGGSNYAVFDLDCRPDGDEEKCATGRTDGILWQQASQDRSSNVTGSSVFDFDADGHAEVAYADECFFRIYDGATGKVAASVGNSSGTAYENPIIADVDGDFRSEIVIAANDLYGATLGCPATDPLFPSTAKANTRGVVVFRDANDGWASSRPIWNQHAYSVVNVTDSGDIPKTSKVASNWNDPKLNNFRQNAQGDLEALGLGDLTISDAGSSCDGAEPALNARVCNRGTLPVPDGLDIAFKDGKKELCLEHTSAILPPGECVIVTCAMGGADLKSPSVGLLADPDNTQHECFEKNNASRATPITCR
jgi:hypothetical protein